MRGVKSEATKRRELLESKGKITASSRPPVSPERSAKARISTAKAHLARGNVSEDYVRGVEIGSRSALEPIKAREKQVGDILHYSLKNQDDPVGRARQILKNVMPDMAKRLASIVQGQEKGWGPREQLQAMKLSAEIVGMVDKSGGLGGEDAPLSQQTVGTLRQVIAAGEARIAELQAQLDGLAVEGEAVQVLEEEGGPGGVLD